MYTSSLPSDWSTMTTWTMTTLDDGQPVATYEAATREEAAELLRAAMYGDDVERVRARQLERARTASHEAALAA